MTLITYPVPCPCGQHEPRKASLPPRMMHTKNARCPFLGPGHQSEVRAGTCCSTDQQVLVNALRAWDREDLVNRISRPLTHGGAEELSADLRGLADFLVGEHDMTEEGRDGTTAKHAIKVLILAALWLTTVASCGFGVRSERR
jgi:hypothetical protein